MLVSHSHRFVFVHIPKTAGTSVASALEPYCQTAKGTRFRRILRKAGVRQDPAKAHFRSHDCASQVLSAFGESAFDSYTVFSVVRNPFDHAISHYAYLREFPKASVAEFFSQMDFGTYLDFRANPGRYRRMPPFARLKDQTEFLYDRRGRRLVHKIIRFETLPDSFNDLVRELGLPDAVLPKERVTKARERSFEHYFRTQEEVNALRRLCRRDFENFGYDPALPNRASQPVPTA